MGRGGGRGLLRGGIGRRGSGEERCPVAKHRGKVIRVEAEEEIAEGVMGRRGVGEAPQFTEPGVMGSGPVGHGEVVIGPGEAGTEGGKEEIAERIEPGAGDAGVGEVGEVFGERAGSHGGLPKAVMPAIRDSQCLWFHI